MCIFVVKELQGEGQFNFGIFENENAVYCVSNSHWFSAGSGLIPVINSETFHIV
jgi:hypothetical protein